MRRLGWLADKPKFDGEEPDHDFKALSARFKLSPPLRASLRELIVEVLDQGSLGACVAHAGFQAIRANHVRNAIARATTPALAIAARMPATAPKLGSRLFGYYFARAYDHTTALDVGTHLRSFFQGANKFGFPHELYWPYDDAPETFDGSPAPFQRMPSTLAITKAFARKAPTLYRRIFETGGARIDAVKKAIANGYCVCFGTDVTRAFTENQLGGKPVDRPTANDEIAGGHAMCLAGYEDENFDVVNSWGTGWGADGWCEITAEYLTWDKTRDLWVVEHAPVEGEI